MRISDWSSDVCSSDLGVDGYVERPVEAIYNEAMDHMEAGWYKTAAELFDDVERQHPYSAWATKAQLMAAYANYLRDAYDEAVIGIDRFIERSEEHTSELQSLMRISYAVFCLKKKKKKRTNKT